MRCISAPIRPMMKNEKNINQKLITRGASVPWNLMAIDCGWSRGSTVCRYMAWCTVDKLWHRQPRRQEAFMANMAPASSATLLGSPCGIMYGEGCGVWHLANREQVTVCTHHLASPSPHPHLASPHLASPHLAPPHLTSPHLALPRLL